MSDNRRDESAEPGANDWRAAGRRDARIEQLERALADEREHVASLRRTADELRFKNDVLEKGYAKQLEDARALAESTEKSRAELAARVAELDAARVDAIELLEQAKTEIDRLAAERDRLRRRRDPEADGASDRAEDASIDELMDDDSWLRQAGPGVRDDESARAVEAAESGGDMIDPDLVFAGDKARD